MVAASFAGPGFPPSASACDPSRLSEILPTLMQRYGLESRVSETLEDARRAMSADMTRSLLRQPSCKHIPGTASTVGACTATTHHSRSRDVQ